MIKLITLSTMVALLSVGAPVEVPDFVDRTANGCGDCTMTGTQHVADGAQPGDHSEGHGWHPSSPYTQNCTAAHGVCGGDGEEEDSPERLTQEAEMLVHAGDVHGLRELAGSSRVFFNWDRNAIQVLDCDGDHVFGHVPIPTHAVSVIEELMDER